MSKHYRPCKHTVLQASHPHHHHHHQQQQQQRQYPSPRSNSSWTDGPASDTPTESSFNTHRQTYVTASNPFVTKQPDVRHEASKRVDTSHMMVLQECVREASRQLAYFINAVNAVDHNILTSPTKIPRSGMAEAVASKDDVDDPIERRRDWRRRRVKVIGAAQLHQRLTNHCRTISDDILPGLVEALRELMKAQSGKTKNVDGGVKAQLIFVGEVIGSLWPCIQTLLVARQFLDEMNDPNLVASLTSLVLAVAESVARMRSAATTSLNKLAFFEADEEREGFTYAEEERVLASTAGEEFYYPDDVDDDDGVRYEVCQAEPPGWLSLASIELCDAAYRQIQSAGSCLESCNWSSVDDNDHVTSLLGSIVSSSYEIGSSMEVMSRAAEHRDMRAFSTAVTQFADAVSRLMVSAAQVGIPGRHLMIVVGAIRHCACSLVTSARLLTGHCSNSYADFSVHSRALSRALTELVKLISSTYKHRR